DEDGEDASALRESEGEGGGEHAGFLLNWTWAKKLPWGVLILFGGGLSLAGAISDTGLTEWIGGAVGGLAAFPTLAIVGAAAVYAFGTRFRAAGMGSDKADAGSGDGDG
ncbi:MAG: SLC13 family permease, partial [Gemmatimonadota bacterium]